MTASPDPLMKLVYVKRWRTLVNLPAKYAEEIIASLSLPSQPDARDVVIALDDDAPTCERCGAIVHDPCMTDEKQSLCALPSFCFPSGRERLLRATRLRSLKSGATKP